MKKATTILLILLLFPTMAFAEEPTELKTITKEYEFETTSHIFECEPPDKVTEDGVVYFLKTVEYEELDREDLFIESTESITKEIVKEKMLSQDDTVFDKIITVDDLKVGFIGVTSSAFLKPEARLGFMVLDIAEQVAKFVPEVDNQCDILVVLANARDNVASCHLAFT